MIAVALRAMLGSVDIKVELLTTDLKTHYVDLVMGKYQMALVGWGGTPDPKSFLTAFEYQGGENTYNISNYNSPIFDAQMTRARSQIGMKERNAAFAAAETTMLRDVAMVPLYSGIGHVLIQPAVEGAYLHGTGLSADVFIQMGG